MHRKKGRRGMSEKTWARAFTFIKHIHGHTHMHTHTHTHAHTHTHTHTCTHTHSFISFTRYQRNLPFLFKAFLTADTCNSSQLVSEEKTCMTENERQREGACVCVCVHTRHTRVCVL